MNYYEVLGLQPGAHPAEIELAYRDLCAQDSESGNNRMVGLAYQTLINPMNRLNYIKMLQEQDEPLLLTRPQTQMITQACVATQSPATTYCCHQAPMSAANKALSGFVIAYVVFFLLTSAIPLIGLLFS